MEDEMKRPDVVATELREALGKEYLPTPADRERVRSKLRERLGGAVLSNSTSVSTSLNAGARSGQLRAIGGLAGVAGFCAVIVFSTARTRPPEASGARASSAALEAPALVVPATTPEVAPETASISVEALPSAPTSVVARPRATSRAAQATPSSDEDVLAKEARLMGSANDRLRAGDLAGALGLFDRHAREFPAGVLVNERIVGRVIALCGLGRRDEASADARRFLETQPQSPLTRRLESSCVGSAAEHTRAADDEAGHRTR